MPNYKIHKISHPDKIVQINTSGKAKPEQATKTTHHVQINQETDVTMIKLKDSEHHQFKLQQNELQTN